MPALKNARHERFAQELAKGKSQEEAYREAGYRGDRTAASRLSTNVNIRARVAELAERAAARTEVTVAGLTSELLDILATAKQGDTAGHLNAARQSVMDIAKLNGLVIDKAEVKSEIEVTDARERLARIVAGHATARNTDEGAGKPH